MTGEKCINHPDRGTYQSATLCRECGMMNLGFEIPKDLYPEIRKKMDDHIRDAHGGKYGTFGDVWRWKIVPTSVGTFYDVECAYKDQGECAFCLEDITDLANNW